MATVQSDRDKKTLVYMADIENANLILMIINIFVERLMNNQWLTDNIL